MAHMEKFTMGTASGVLLHDERSETEDRTRSNVDIDPNRTHLNYNLLKEPVSARDFGKYLCDFTSQNEIYLLNRKDVNVLTSWIVTLPTEVKQEEQERFFYEAYRFLCERYGFKETSKNIISAAVHMDETTPHLHFKFIPVAYDSKKQRFTVSAKNVVDRKDLQTFHKDLSERMKQVFGRDVGILNGETQNVRNVAELKSRGGKIEKQLAQAEARLIGLEKEYSGLAQMTAMYEAKKKESEELRLECDALRKENKKLQHILSKYQG